MIRLLTSKSYFKRNISLTIHLKNFRYHLKGVVNPSLLQSFGQSHLSKYFPIYADLISLYITRVSTSFSKNSLIIIDYKIGSTEIYLNTPPFKIFFFFSPGITQTIPSMLSYFYTVQPMRFMRYLKECRGSNKCSISKVTDKAQSKAN